MPRAASLECEISETLLPENRQFTGKTCQGIAHHLVVVLGIAGIALFELERLLPHVEERSQTFRVPWASGLARRSSNSTNVS